MTETETARFEITRADGGADIVVQGWSDTHVLFDVWDNDARRWKLNFSRPILPFMLDYGLFNPSSRAVSR